MSGDLDPATALVALSPEPDAPHGDLSIASGMDVDVSLPDPEPSAASEQSDPMPLSALASVAPLEQPASGNEEPPADAERGKPKVLPASFEDAVEHFGVQALSCGRLFIERAKGLSFFRYPERHRKGGSP